jgi:hypothetical protein
MTRKLIRVERLLSRAVRDSAGQRAGRIEDIRASRQQNHYMVEEYLLGYGGLFHRLSIVGFAMSLLGVMGARKKWVCRVPWDMMDLTDPHKPRLRCRRDELKSDR